MLYQRLTAAVALCALGAGFATPCLGQFTITPNGAGPQGGLFSSGPLAPASPANLTGAGNMSAVLRAPAPYGGVDHLGQSAWWFRGSEDGREYTFGNGTAGGYRVVGTSVGDTTGGQISGGYRFEVFDSVSDIRLFSSIQQWIIIAINGSPFLSISNTVFNSGTTPLDITLFHFGDLNPSGSVEHNWKFFASSFIMSSGALDMNYFGNAPDELQGGTASAIRALLSDGDVDVLNNDVGVGPGDFGGAYGWHFVIPVDGAASAVCSIAVPGPGMGSVLVAGVVGVGGRRRRRR